ncbi:TonB-dependent receptor [Qipengyuania sp. GH29]|nr:TonB-dependent receptor [Qipengyuania sphaerica]
MRNTLVSVGGRTALYASAGLAALAFSTAAYSQDSDDDVDSPAVEEIEEQVAEEGLVNAEGGDNAIVVTGSRIRRDEFSAIEPITVITAEEVTQAGFANATDALQSQAVAAGSSIDGNFRAGFITDGGTGINTIGLRNLGPGRTLVLLNGHRLSPAGVGGSVGSVDLNTIPTAILQRIEVLKAGASSIYGSDAIGGVINAITNTNLDGLVVDASVNVPEIGAGISTRAAISFGKQMDRFRFLGSVEYFNREEIQEGDVSYTSCPINGQLTGEGSAFGSADPVDAFGRNGPEGVQCYTIRNGGTTINTVGLPRQSGIDRVTGEVVPFIGGNTGFNRFVPAPGTPSLPDGEGGFTPAGFLGVGLDNRDLYDPRYLQTTLLTPAETITGYLELGYELDILGNAEIYSETLLTQRKSSNTFTRQLLIDYLVGSELLPAELRDGVFLAAGDTTTGFQPIAVRTFIGAGLFTNTQEVDFSRFAGGLRGDFFFDGWRYDLYASKSFSDGEVNQLVEVEPNLARSVNVVSDGFGGFVCAETADPNCVPAPAFSPEVVAGNLPQDFLNYVYQPDTSVTKYRETILSAFVDGPLFELPGGDIQLGLGAEYRTNSINDQPGPLRVNSGSASPTVGSDSVWEAFGEIFLPLLSDVPFAYALNVNASARYTDYESYGGDWTYKVAGEYQPAEFIGFRASYGTSYRAPALYEQFLGASSGFLAQSTDPCDFLTSPPTGAALTNCTTEGLNGFIQNSPVRVNRLGGAASGLAAETSDNLSVGVVLQPPLPSSLGDLSIAVDYFDTNIENGVNLVTAGTVLSLCYDQVGGFQPGQGLCRNVSRDAANALTVVTGYQNLSRFGVEGIEGNLRYSVDLGDVNLRLNANVTKYLEQTTASLPTDFEVDFNDSIGAPEWVGVFDATLGWSNVELRYGLTWVGDVDSSDEFVCTDSETGQPFFEGCDQIVRDNYLLDIDDYFTHDASVRFKFDDFILNMGVRNLTDKQPPRITSFGNFGVLYSTVGRSNVPVDSNYDFIGRQWFVNTTFQF